MIDFAGNQKFGLEYYLRQRARIIPSAAPSTCLPEKRQSVSP
jgi:hypothetical protein